METGEERVKCTSCGVETSECYCTSCIAAGAGSSEEELFGD